ncbi:MAG: hypothetical protein SZ59_C0005G0072 [candidate division TM6 bacterium GW2011_GWF2_28_16]|nr:MAG: hypothetical protein SZ59_C0005G0072 [candidate division TM6 bacterium GW2011_GWF2_28_16]
MILKKYIFKRFFYYLLLINISFTFLFSFIEFFEKIIRVKDATIGAILKFIALNSIPSFFEYVNISCWLATIMLLKEFFEQNEWEIFKILNINYKNIFNILIISGIITATLTFAGKELIADKLQNISSQFKFKKFKKINFEILTSKWIEIKDTKKNNEKIFCYFSFFDIPKNLGNNLLIIKISQDFKINKIINSKNFNLTNNLDELKLHECNIVDSNKNKEKFLKSKTILLPGINSQLKAQKNISSVKNLLNYIIFKKNYLPYNLWLELFYELIKKLLLLLQIIIYPTLTFSLFVLFEYCKNYKWLIIFTPYPIMLLLDLLINFFIQFKINPLFLIIPYFLIVLFIFFITKTIEKKYI